MRPFQILTPATLEEARAALGGGAVSMIVAGGTDIMGEMQEGTVSPDTLISIDGVRGPDGMDGIEISDDGASIGSLATLADNRLPSRDFSARISALAEAAASVATPQIRNVGTLGGNLSQRPRCWYYRSPKFSLPSSAAAIPATRLTDSISTTRFSAQAAATSSTRPIPPSRCWRLTLLLRFMARFMAKEESVPCLRRASSLRRTWI